MRRKDKEIVSVNEKIKIIDANKICRLGLSDNNQPYIVPLNYGYSFENDVLTLYFHSANEGRKFGIIKKNNCACFEIDCGGYLIAADEPCRYGYVFQSIIGTGKIILLDTINEKITALNKIMQHQTGKNELFNFDEKMMNRIIVYKMVVEEFTGKGDLSTNN
jgi:nitroimidazol reductase NimA-like FMN-containing flavoprotein (pyridoxamine 5'-phosphate oxidase superfamily)